MVPSKIDINAFGFHKSVTSLLVLAVVLTVFSLEIVHAGPTRPSGQHAGKPQESRLDKREAPAVTQDSDGQAALDDSGIDMKAEKKSFGMGPSAFHEDTFNNGFGSFSTMKRNPFGGGSRGFHDDAFSRGFGEFSTMRRKKFGSGLHHDGAFHGRSSFSGGFGDFSTMKKRFSGPSGFHADTFSQGFGGFSTMKRDDGLLRRLAENEALQNILEKLYRANAIEREDPIIIDDEY